MSIAAPSRTATALPGTLSLGLARGSVELKQFFRQKEDVVFTFAMPAFLMVLLSSIFDDVHEGTGVSASQVFAASLIGAGIISTSFISMGIGITADREDGTLKRLRGTPMPATSYFVGKLVLVVVASLAEVILLLVVAALLFGLRLPTATVQDDGKGFDPGTRPGRYGLAGMQARAGEVGGSLDVTSAPGAGTTVTLEVPAC